MGLFSYWYNSDQGKWRRWDQWELVPRGVEGGDAALAAATQGRDSSKLLVKTCSTAATMFMTQRLLDASVPALLLGPVASGKTEIVMETVKTGFAQSHDFFSVHLTTHDGPQSIRNAIFRRLHLQAGSTDVFGPPPGRSFAMFFDDMNLPIRDEFGAQPPLEFLRHMMERGGFYDLDFKHAVIFRRLARIGHLAAMQPTLVNENTRLRHRFVSIHIPRDERSNLGEIFAARLKAAAPSLSEKIIEGLLAATLDVFEKVSARFVPSPYNLHYIFSLRNMLKLCEGVAVWEKEMNDPLLRSKVWLHEAVNVFGNCLSTQGEKDLCASFVEDAALLHILCGGEESSIIITHQSKTMATSKRLVLIKIKHEATEFEVRSLQSLQAIVQQHIVSSNCERSVAFSADALVLFDDAVLNVARILRALRSTEGHVVVLGDVGTGRRTSLKIAISLLRFRCIAVQSCELCDASIWRNRLRRELLKCTMEKRESVLVVCDDPNVDAEVHKDIDTFLCTGDFLFLFESEEIDAIVHRFALETSQTMEDTPSRNDILVHFGRLCQNLFRIAVVLTRSSSRRNIQQRFRQFPSLISRCQIISMSAWNRSNLIEVARKRIMTINAERLDDDEMSAFVRTNTYKPAPLQAKAGKGKMIAAANAVGAVGVFTKGKGKGKTRSRNTGKGNAAAGGKLRKRTTIVASRQSRRRTTRRTIVKRMSQIKKKKKNMGAGAKLGVKSSFMPMGNTRMSIPEEGAGIGDGGGRILIIPAKSPSQVAAAAAVETAASFFASMNDVVRAHCSSNVIGYVEMINSFQDLYLPQKTKLQRLVEKYQTGLDRFAQVRKEVSLMKEELAKLEPLLIEKSKAVQTILQEIEEERARLEEVTVAILGEEAEAKRAQERASRIKDECEKDLKAALPILQKAQGALKSLSAQEISEIKGMRKPPEGVKLVMKAVSVMMGVKRKKKSKKKIDAWEFAKKKLLGSSSFTRKLLNYDKDNIPDKVIKQIQVFLENPKFDPEVIGKSSCGFAEMGLIICHCGNSLLHTHTRSLTVSPPTPPPPLPPPSPPSPVPPQQNRCRQNATHLDRGHGRVPLGCQRCTAKESCAKGSRV